MSFINSYDELLITNIAYEQADVNSFAGPVRAVLGWGILCGQKVVRGIAEWAQAHAAMILEAWGEALPRIPSESTLRPALRYADVEGLEKHVAGFNEELRACRPAPSREETGGWEGQALDGKEVRGANTHRAQLHLVSLVAQESGTVPEQHLA